ncbi:DUF4136 domain-containing protein [Colwellia sp. MEBiC06753]
MKQLKIFIAIAFTSLLYACVQVESAPASSPLAVSSVRDLPTNYAQGSSFVLQPRFLKKYSLSESEQQKLYQQYGQAIVSVFEQAGYQHAKSQTPDFVIGYGIALSSDFSDDNISKLFGVSPGLADNNAAVKGSFLIYVEDAETKQRVWRGAVQGFTQNEFTQEQREQRIANVIDMVISQFFKSS